MSTRPTTNGKTRLPPELYEKTVDQVCRIGEAQQIAQQAAIPAFIGARFALIVAGLSLVMSAAAIAIAVARR